MPSVISHLENFICLVSRYLLKGIYKNLNVLVGLVLRYLLSIVFTVTGIAPLVNFPEFRKQFSKLEFLAFQN